MNKFWISLYFKQILMLESSTRYKNNKVVIGLNYTIIFYRAILKPRAKKEIKLEKMYN